MKMVQKGRLKKVEKLMNKLHRECDTASRKEEWEKARSMGMTLTPQQIYSQRDRLWEDLKKEITRKVREGNAFAIPLATAIEQEENQGEIGAKKYFFTNAYDEYLSAILQ